MQKHIGWFCIVGFVAMLTTANAQNPSPATAISQFDGTYAFVSSTKVDQTYTNRNGPMLQCPDFQLGRSPLQMVRQGFRPLASLRRQASRERLIPRASW
jgi:hypothetical protein